MTPLEGIRVVDAGILIQGPAAAAILWEWGADVVKVELPEIGDQTRWMPVSPDDDRSPYFIANNRGKRSITTDLRTPAGREVFLRLVDTADVVVSNFKPGTMEDWGLGYTEISARNPRIVYGTGSSFGPVGPDSKREGADLVGQAAGGILSTTIDDDGRPRPIGVAVADHIASLNLAAGILAALVCRDRTGVGQQVDASLLGGQIWAQASEYTRYLLSGEMAGPSKRSVALVPGIVGVFPTADGSIAVAGVSGRARTAFYEAIGTPELADEFAHALYSEEDKARLFAKLDMVFATRSTGEWCQLLDETPGMRGARYAPVRDHAEVVGDSGAWENGYFGTADGSGAESVVGSPVRFSSMITTRPGAAPELGQHTEEVLLEVGYTWEDIADLGERGVI
jgi:CoA:oxalate CoA-transferase